MKSSEIEKLRERLKALIARMQPDVNALADETRSPAGGQAGGALTNAPLHLGDMGSEEIMHDLSTTLLENEARMVAEANEALRRIDDGTYGVCEGCRRPIALARLEAIPFVR